MILYLGSSSLMQLYMNESHSESVSGWVRAAEIVATCRIAYTEIMSALNIRFRKGHLSKDDHDLVVKRFSDDWQGIAKVDFDDLEAGRLIERYGLTRFGALHLSAAKLILAEWETYNHLLESEDKKFNSIGLFFSSKDPVLCKAAIKEGLKVLPLD